MTTVTETSPAVKRTPANDEYRAHLFSDCDSCAGGHYCSILDLLDWLAAREATEAHRVK